MQTYSKEKTVFIESYIQCALWSSVYTDNDGMGHYMDDGVHDLSFCAFGKLDKIASSFFDNNRALIIDFINSINSTYDNAGHLLWLSTNGHGSGYFDYSDNVYAIQLNVLCSNSNPMDLYIGDDGLIYV